MSKAIVCLVGAPGTGKTTLGTQLSADLGIPFVSIDDFGRRGDYRNRWRRLVRCLSRQHGTVLVESNVIPPPIRPTLARTPHLVIELRAPEQTRAERLRQRGEPGAEIERILPARPVGYRVDVALSEGRHDQAGEIVRGWLEGGLEITSASPSSDARPRHLPPRKPQGRKPRRRKQLPTRMRGYGSTHQRLRRQLAPAVEAGVATCSRCGEQIKPGEPWDLGHDDHDRRRYTGPEHQRCNRATAGRRRRRSREW